jgi:hypothetical protein
MFSQVKTFEVGPRGFRFALVVGLMKNIDILPTFIFREIIRNFLGIVAPLAF